jgi:hypothetical protein
MITEADRKLLDYRMLWEVMRERAIKDWPYLDEQMEIAERIAIEGIKKDMEKEKMNSCPQRISNLRYHEAIALIVKDPTLWAKRSVFDKGAGYAFKDNKIQFRIVETDTWKVVILIPANIEADDWYVEKMPRKFMFFEEALKGYRQGKVMVNNNDDTDRPHFGRRYIKRYIINEEDVAITLKEITSKTWSLEEQEKP